MGVLKKMNRVNVISRITVKHVNVYANKNKFFVLVKLFFYSRCYSQFYLLKAFPVKFRLL